MRKITASFTVLAAALLLADSVMAVVGNPFTPMSYAGVARRTTRRAAYAGAAYSSGAYYAGAAYTSAAVATTATAMAIGATVSALPSGCANILSGGISYYHCGSTYYRPYYQGANLSYVVVQAP